MRTPHHYEVECELRMKTNSRGSSSGQSMKRRRQGVALLSLLLGGCCILPPGTGESDSLLGLHEGIRGIGKPGRFVLNAHGSKSFLSCAVWMCSWRLRPPLMSSSFLPFWHITHTNNARSHHPITSHILIISTHSVSLPLHHNSQALPPYHPPVVAISAAAPQAPSMLGTIAKTMVAVMGGGAQRAVMQTAGPPSPLRHRPLLPPPLRRVNRREE